MPSFIQDKNITKLCGAEIKKSAPTIPERERGYSFSKLGMLL
jgi:hypothetical protein